MALYEDKPCTTCSGTGISRYGGHCFECDGSGKVTVRTEPRKSELSAEEIIRLSERKHYRTYLAEHADDAIMARLTFQRWLVETGRLSGDTKPYREGVA